jgi:ribosomal protein L16/L10AE
MCPGVPTRVGVVQWSGPDNGAAPSSSVMRTDWPEVRNRKVRINTVGEFCPWTATIVKERYMIEYNLDSEHSILHVQPKCATENDDFVKLAKAVNPHIEATGGLAGLIIETPGFPGWRRLGAMVNQFRFVRDHHKRIKRIGVVTDSHMGDVAEHLTSHFVSAEIKHFPAGQIEAARQWIMNGS